MNTDNINLSDAKCKEPASNTNTAKVRSAANQKNKRIERKLQKLAEIEEAKIIYARIVKQVEKTCDAFELCPDFKEVTDEINSRTKYEIFGSKRLLYEFPISKTITVNVEQEESSGCAEVRVSIKNKERLISYEDYTFFQSIEYK